MPRVGDGLELAGALMTQDSLQEGDRVANEGNFCAIATSQLADIYIMLPVFSIFSYS